MVVGEVGELVIRANGGPGLGVGHLSRCLALAQEWRRRGGPVTLVASMAPAAWIARYEASGCRVLKSAATDVEATWWAMDGYDLPTRDHHQGHSRTLIIDDFDTAGTRGDGADLVVDQNLDATAAAYPAASRVLCGARYALLRDEVRSAKAPARVGSSSRVLVALGGAPDDDLIDFGEALASDPRLADAEVWFARGSDHIEGALAGSDLAFSTAGSICWELSYHGVPMLLRPLNAHQERIAASLITCGAAEMVDRNCPADVAAGRLAGLLHDVSTRAAMGSRARELIDGRGASRVVDCMLG